MEEMSRTQRKRITPDHLPQGWRVALHRIGLLSFTVAILRYTFIGEFFDGLLEGAQPEQSVELNALAPASTTIGDQGSGRAGL